MSQGTGSASESALESALREQVAARTEALDLPTTPPDPGLTRRLDLLWRGAPPNPRGRPPRFTLAEVVDAGVAVADVEGIAGVTMRAVAGALGTAAMSLYTYVPAREDLLDLMVDRCYATLTLPDGAAPWRQEVLTLADGLLAMYLAHPWLLDLNRWRLPLAPHVFDADESLLRILDDAGLPPEQVSAVSEVVGILVHGFARSVVVEQAAARGGTSGDEHWRASSSFWETHYQPERYPTMTKLWFAGAFDPEEDDLHRRLTPLLDGIERELVPPA